MTKTNNGAWALLKPAVVLLAIGLVIAALLGAVNSVTADRIEALQAEKTANAMRQVLDAANYEPITDFTDETGLVQSLYAAKDESGSPLGYVAEVLPSGFGGAIDIMVGMDCDLAVTGVSIISSSETSGLGLNASRESFRGQYIGQTGGALAVTKDGGTIDALTGATITSRAVTDGVNAACNAAASVQ